MNLSGIQIVMVAGEESGDILGASLIQHLKQHFPRASFSGVGGRRMIAEGFHSFFPIESLSVMGFIEPLKCLPRLLKIRKWLKNYILASRPAVFIGIDYTEFNLSLELTLKSHGIKTVHYVSPTVWAWRQGRIKKIKKAVDLMLTLFSFETPIYQAHHISVECVGHPLADHIPFTSDKLPARQQLNLPLTSKVIALLPGSRAQELKYLAPAFIKTAQWILAHEPNIVFITAAANDARLQQFSTLASELNGNFVQIFTDARLVMQAADAILVASGTASLEAMLVKRPTIIAYKMSALTYAIAKRLVKIPFLGLPNILAGQCIMPEFIQDAVKPEIMGKTLLNILQSDNFTNTLLPIFEKLHLALRKNAPVQAALAIAKLIKDNNSDEADCRRG